MTNKKSHSASIADFFSREYTNLKGFVKKSLNERYYRVSAEDIIQDVALNIFSMLDFDNYVENAGAYVYRAIKNRIIDYQRKSIKDVSLEQHEADKEENHLLKDMVEESPEKIIDDEKFYEVFYEALGKLSP